MSNVVWRAYSLLANERPLNNANNPLNPRGPSLAESICSLLSCVICARWQTLAVHERKVSSLSFMPLTLQLNSRQLLSYLGVELPIIHTPLTPVLRPVHPSKATTTARELRHLPCTGSKLTVSGRFEAGWSARLRNLICLGRKGLDPQPSLETVSLSLPHDWCGWFWVTGNGRLI